MWATVLVLCGLLHPLMHLASGQERCVTPRSESGICIDIKTCPSLLNLLLRRRTADIDLLRQSLCGFQGTNTYKVCCPVNGQGNNRSRADESRSSFFNFLTPPQCGLSNASHSRVVGGVPAELDAYPWIAALGYVKRNDRSKPKFLCGGALISSRHVLTAAHCVLGREDLKFVRLGELDFSSTTEGAHPIDVPISSKTIHHEYSKTQHINDIAVLTLENHVQFTDSIHPICLPAAEPIINKNLTLTYPFIAGWGRLNTDGPTSERLMEVQVPVVSTASCRSSYSSLARAVIDDSVVCAGYGVGGKDACQGDSGGPLMLPQGKTFYIIGVVSYGYKCAEPGYPGVYTRVTKFLDFISDVMRNTDA